MKRIITAAAIALACNAAIVANAQNTESKTKVEGDKGAVITFTGCLRSATSEERSFVLNQVISSAERNEPQRNVVSTFSLVPGPSVQLEQFVGHRVQVSGMMVGPDSKVETTTKIENKNGPDTTIKEETKTKGAAGPQFRVISVKQVADAC